MTKISLIGTAILGAVAFGLSTPVSAATFIQLNSQPGEYIGGGITQRFTPIDGLISASGNINDGVNITFRGDNIWDLGFAPPQGSSLIPGIYEGATRLPFKEPNEPGIEVAGAGRGCNTLTGKFNVLEAIYGADGSVERFDADFEQFCDGNEAALFGQVRFNIADSQASVEEIKQNIQIESTELEKLLAFSDKIQELPTALYFFSEPGDFIGAGLEQTFTPEEADFNVSRNFRGGTSFLIDNAFRPERDNFIFWILDFAPPVDLPLVPGSYGKATRFPFNSPVKPGLSFSGDGRGCNTLTGQFVVLDAAYNTDGSVKRFDSIFKQNCGVDEASLYGRIRYNATVTTVPEPISSIGLFALGTLGAVSTLKRKLKSSTAFFA